MIKKALVIGSGFLGNHVINTLNDLGIQSVGTHYNTNDNKIPRADIRRIDSVNNCILKYNPDVIINCAANVHLDYLEKNPDLAFSINAEGAKNVAKISRTERIKLIHISTDGVFDGTRGMYTEDDIPNPINEYARSKFLGEEFVKENASDYIIIRTNFYGNHPEGKFLFNWIISTLNQNKEIIGFDDVIFTPLEISNLSKMIVELALSDYSGIIHLASNEAISKYKFSLMVADAFQLDKNLIKRGSIDEIDFIAKRPKNTSLSNRKSKRLINTPIISLYNWLQLIKSNCDSNLDKITNLLES